MHLHNGKLVRTDPWREGKYLDLWSVPHFMSGMSVALGLSILGLGLGAATVVGLIMLIAWEFFEYFAGIEEGRINSILDVVVGMVSFFPTFMWAAEVSLFQIVIAFVVVTGADLFLSSFGWKESHKAHVLEEKLHAEYIEQRDKMRKRRSQLRLRIQEGRTKWKMRRKWWKARKPGARNNLAQREDAPTS